MNGWNASVCGSAGPLSTWASTSTPPDGRSRPPWSSSNHATAPPDMRTARPPHNREQGEGWIRTEPRNEPSARSSSSSRWPRSPVSVALGTVLDEPDYVLNLSAQQKRVILAALLFLIAAIRPLPVAAGPTLAGHLGTHRSPAGAQLRRGRHLRFGHEPRVTPHASDGGLAELPWGQLEERVRDVLRDERPDAARVAHQRERLVVLDGRGRADPATRDARGQASAAARSTSAQTALARPRRPRQAAGRAGDRQAPPAATRPAEGRRTADASRA
jgi:hypothetical protein